MAVYKAPLRDMEFILKEVIGLSSLQRLPGGDDLSEDLVNAVLEEAAKFTENIIFPLNEIGDREGCKWEDGKVTTPTGFKEAYQSFIDGGWASLAFDPQYGGQGLPETISMMIEEMICSANLSFSLYPGLTRGAGILLQTHGTDSLKQKYLPALIEGRWGGTMCLTEAHCGTDLGLLKTRAIAQEDGTYRLTGTKIFISSGEHNLPENILHFVIARSPQGVRGIRGISLFLVPKILVNEDGSLGEINGVHCASIEHKMGLKGSCTCVLNFDNAQGYLIGELNKGVAHMFTMMNSERVGVGLQGLGVGEVSYQNALAYARERIQGRSLSGIKSPKQEADPIIWHPDVRRMLLTMKTSNEGNRLLALWVAYHLDVAHRSSDLEEREEAADFVQLMTPIVKAFLTDSGFEMANLGLQVYGGHGYIQDYPMEQYVRDARISQIYEGTNGIQALDLVGRKLPAHTGRYARSFFHPIDQFIEKYRDEVHLKEFLEPLEKSFTRLQQVTAILAERSLKNPEEAGSVATDYLKMFGLVACGYLWGKVALISSPKVTPEGASFYDSKMVSARFFMQKMLPQTSSLMSTIMSGSKPLMDVQDSAFGPF